MNRLILMSLLSASLLLASCVDRSGQQPQTGKAPVKGAAGPARLYAEYPESSAAVEHTELPAGLESGSFTRLDSGETGLDFSNIVGSPAGLLDRVASQGGLAAGDYDMDGDIDIYACGADNGNRLYRNEGGFRFTDVTEEAGEGLDIAGQLALSATFADLSADGLPDLYVCVRDGANRFFLNAGDGSFTEQAAGYGIDSARASVAATVLDMDGDGMLDLYVANSRIGSASDGLLELERMDQENLEVMTKNETGQSMLDQDAIDEHYIDNAGKVRERPDNDLLYISDGDGGFVNEAASIGIVPYCWSNSALAADFNDDGWPDMVVSGDLDTPDWYYMSNARGYFRERGRTMLLHNSFFGKGIDAGDLDRDGWMDYMVAGSGPVSWEEKALQDPDPAVYGHELANYNPQQNFRNTVFLNRGDGWMTESARLLGLDSSGWTWSVRLADLDSDGLLDVMTTSGSSSSEQHYEVQQRVLAMRSAGASQAEIDSYMASQPGLPSHDLAFRAQAPLEYVPAPGNWGIEDPAVSCGMLLEDLDGDGDLDLLMNNVNGELAAYRNDIAQGSQLLLDLRQPGGNSEAVGARVIAHCGDDQFLSEVIISRGYASAGSSRIHIGLGSHEQVDALWIRWPDRQCEVLRDLPANRIYRVTRGAELKPFTPERSEPLFSTEELNWQHVETDTLQADLAAEPLVPLRLSSLGGGLGIADLDGDSLLDIYFSGALGENGKLFTGRPGGGFVSSPALDSVTDPRQENMAVLVLESNADGRTDLLLGAGGNEYPAGSNYYTDRLAVNTGDGYELGVMSAPAASSGSSCASDIDLDGDLDVLLSGRQAVHEFLSPGLNHILVNDGGSFSLATGRTAPGLADLGPVTDALFADFSGDGRQDLLLAVEYGGIELWENRAGIFVPREAVAPPGTWQSLACGDFDNDGDLDFLAGGYGRNTDYGSGAASSYIVSGDIDGNGSRDLLELVQGVDGELHPLRGPAILSRALEGLSARFPTREAFAGAGTEELFGDLSAAEWHEAQQTASCVFINNGGGGFTMSELPFAAQMSIVFGMAVADYDNDGNLDAWLNQNFRNLQPQASRWTGSYGVLLLGDGTGGFNALSPLQSGILLDAEGRGAAAGDFNNDGLVDIAISVSNGSPRIATARPEGLSGHSLKVMLAGPAGNPAGVGARLRLELSDGSLQFREVLAGHTYLSSYSGPVLFGIPEGLEASKLEVDWPGGGVSTVEGIGSIDKVVVALAE